MLLTSVAIVLVLEVPEEIFMDELRNTALPQFVVFEGVDGSGKTSLFKSLVKYYEMFSNELPLFADSFPGSFPGTLGEWVYRLHHNKATDGFTPANIAPPALQMLHMAAHVDTILTRIAPILTGNGFVILDRYWWSTYAYSRSHLSADQVWSLVNFERMLWKELPQPTIIYLTRQSSLKPREIDPAMHTQLDLYYREVIKAEKENGLIVDELRNNGTLEDAWRVLLGMLHLPYYEVI
jgi:thymidylate kinase